MATISKVPFGGYQLGNYLGSPGGTQESVISGLFPFTARAGSLSGLGTQNPLIRMCVMTEDVGTNPQVVGTSGRYLRLWTRDAYGTVAANSFDPAGGLMPGQGGSGILGDPPDFCSQAGFVFVADGSARTTAPGAYAAVTPMPESPVLVDAGMTDTGGVVTDRTAVMRSTTANDVPFLAAAAADNDAVYFGTTGNRFSRLYVQSGTGTAGTGTYTVAWEYWNGSAWTALAGVSDATNAFKTLTSFGLVSFTEPSDWATTSVGNTTAYWIRARKNGGTVTIAPLGDQIRPSKYRDETGSALTLGTAIGAGGVDTLNDAYYFGVASLVNYPGTTMRMRVNVTTARGGNSVYVYEYWNGSAWTALSGVSDGTSAFSSPGDSDFTFTVPGNWTARTVGGLSRLWMRFRVSTAATLNYAAPAGTAAYAFVTAAAALTAEGHAALYVGEDPGSAAPAIVSWGIEDLASDVPPIVSATSGVAYWYDSKRRIYSKGTAVAATSGATLQTRNHLASHVDEVVFVAGGTAGSGGTGTRYPKATLSPASNGTVTVTTLSGGGPLYPPNTSPTRAAGQVGQFLSCATGRARVVLAGSYAVDTSGGTGIRASFRNTVGWSELNQPHYFPAANYTTVGANDGDEIVAVRELFDKFYVFKRGSIWVLTIDPAFNLSLVTSGVGAYSKRSVIKAGNVLIFHGPGGVYTIDGGGNLSKLPISAGIQRVIEGLNENALRNSCAAWWPERLSYFLALPGLLSKLTGSGSSVPGATSGVTGATNPINDVILQCHLPTSQWSIWVGEGCFAASMTSMWATSDSMELWTGGYFGRAYRADYSKYLDGMEAAGFTYEGTITTAIPIGGTSVIDSAATFPVSGSDRRHLELFVWIPLQGEVRRVTASSATGLTVAPSWNGSYAIGTRYYLGNIYASVETGDLTFGSPFTHKALAAVRLLTNKARGAAMDIDLAVTPAGVDTVTAASYAGGTVGTAYPPNRVMMPFKPGYTLRLLTAMRMGGPATAPVEIRGLELELTTLGRPGG